MSETPSSVVIVGAGLAGAKTAEALRKADYTGPITLIGSESDLPYERPPLSKSYLQGKSPFDDALTHPEGWYADNNVQLRLSSEVSALHPDTAEVELADGTREGYGALVLATGSEPVRLPIPGIERALTLRTHADADAIRATFGSGRRLVIIGGGWIGLEVAAAARELDTAVTVLESAKQPLLHVVGPDIAPVFADLHRAHGVDLRLGAQVSTIEEDGVRLADGELIPADAVVVGVGARPRIDLARDAGLAVDGGVLVDAQLRTSDPAIYAVGDIADEEHSILGRRIRVEHWATALNQPATAAAALLGGPDTYDRLPYFFSDQYDLGLEYVGDVPKDADARVVVRGDLAGREFVAFWLDPGDRLLAAMNVNVWDVPDEVKPLIAAGTPVNPDRLTDPSVPYSALGG
ncbi:NAD(P)/FAD-dependent oxidoreductase [Jongsikchunia kroppenstedtii]|uniref:NAD(P)/FAD-dependent oxidoreductase n=1 Tax=Jongsikchunia kroppenstedtii TaxID=1121721 RepID=UPI00036E2707|nr:FAD-dependent oxidoreductase [Jongsikchunia kroppenstedtii]